MKKGLIVLLLMTFWVFCTCTATFANTPTIGIFLEAPVTFVNNETVRTKVPEKAKSLFPESEFNVLSFEKTTTALRTYKEDNRMVVNQYYSQPVNREDIRKIATNLGCDYALFIIITNDAPRLSSMSILHRTFATTVTCDVRLLNIKTGEYVISKQIIKDGTSTGVYVGVPSFDAAYKRALDKVLDELTVDTSLLKESNGLEGDNQQLEIKQ
jgi:hypothetical protein